VFIFRVWSDSSINPHFVDDKLFIHLHLQIKYIRVDMLLYEYQTMKHCLLACRMMSSSLCVYEHGQ
jgi:hypothetical protein